VGVRHVILCILSETLLSALELLLG
jgi:hypothetical protein